MTEDLENELRQFEELFWIEKHAHEHLAPSVRDPLDISAPSEGLLAGEAIEAHLAETSNWRRIELSNFDAVLSNQGNVALVSYLAKVKNEDDKTFQVHCNSTYFASDSGWSLFSHREVPIQ